MSSAGLTRREKQQRTRGSLLKAAARLFCRHGLEGTSVDQIAQAAGYTKGAFYANFKSKEELFLVMLDERFSSELGRIDHNFSDTSTCSSASRCHSDLYSATDSGGPECLL